MPEIAEQNVVVTGANRGIGRVLAREFAREGAHVGLLGRREEAVDETIDELHQELENPELSSLVADVSKKDEVEDAFEEWIDRHDEIHTLINNAGITRDGLVMRMKDEDWNSVLDVNLDGAFFCSKSVVRNMLGNRWGRIIMISSVVGLRGNPGQANYSASKAGLIGLSKSIARELGSRNITANTIAPGYVQTDMTEDLDDDQKDMIIESTPMERIGEAEEVADCALFLASPKSSYITGEVIRVDGGMAM